MDKQRSKSVVLLLLSKEHLMYSYVLNLRFPQYDCPSRLPILPLRCLYFTYPSQLFTARSKSTATFRCRATSCPPLAQVIVCGIINIYSCFCSHIFSRNVCSYEHLNYLDSYLQLSEPYGVLYHQPQHYVLGTWQHQKEKHTWEMKKLAEESDVHWLR